MTVWVIRSLGTRQGTAGRFCSRIGFRLAVAAQMEQPMNACIRTALRHARRACLMSLVGSQVPLARQHSRRTRMTRRGLSPLNLAGVIGAQEGTCMKLFACRKTINIQ